MEQALYEIKLRNEEPVLLKLWFSDNPAATEGCDACISYSIHDRLGRVTIDGGEMDYDSSKAGYGDISDALDDVIDFAFDGKPAEYARLSDLDPDGVGD